MTNPEELLETIDHRYMTVAKYGAVNAEALKKKKNIDLKPIIINLDEYNAK